MIKKRPALPGSRCMRGEIPLGWDAFNPCKHSTGLANRDIVILFLVRMRVCNKRNQNIEKHGGCCAKKQTNQIKEASV